VSPQEVVEALPGQHLHDPPEHVGRTAVVPPRTRREQQRHGAEAFHEGGQIAVAPTSVDRASAVELLDGMVSDEARRQPAGVGQQVPYRDLARRRHGDVPVDVPTGEHLELGEGGDVPGHTVLEQTPSLLVQHHQRHADDGLGHRVDAVDGIVGQLAPEPDVRHPVDVGVAHLSPA
jgi:hypothetical protein